MAVRRRRLDAELVRRGLATDVAAARQAIADGRITVGGGPAFKSTTQVHAGQAIGRRPVVDRRFVSRGGHKLQGALDAFGIDVAGRDALDAGVSTGGFTDCLLQAGARGVEAYDVGYGQVHERLRTDERIAIHERTNIRDVVAGDLTRPAPEVIVADLSFVSLRSLLTPLVALAAPTPAEVDLVLLVKPQFEVAPGDVGEGGVVRDPALWMSAIAGVAAHLAELGFTTAQVAVSPITGPAGNVEFLLHARRADPTSPGTSHPGTPGTGTGTETGIETAIAAGLALSGTTAGDDERETTA